MSSVYIKSPDLTRVISTLGLNTVMLERGMMFIPQLNPDTLEVEGLSKDSPSLIARLQDPHATRIFRGGNQRMSRKHVKPIDDQRILTLIAQKESPHPRPSHANYTIQWPLGQQPTAREFDDCLFVDPVLLFLPAAIPPAHSPEDMAQPAFAKINAYAETCFIGMTRDFYKALHGPYRKNSLASPQTIQDAIQMWSVSWVVENINMPCFKRLNWDKGHVAGRGKIAESFVDQAMKKWGFDRSKAEIPSTGKWSATTYLNSYQQILSNLGNGRKPLLKEALKILIDCMQCMPSGGLNCPSPWSTGRHFYIPELPDTYQILVTNPKHYKIVAITPNTVTNIAEQNNVEVSTESSHSDIGEGGQSNVGQRKRIVSCSVGPANSNELISYTVL
ncbi:hypothetical protein BD410DRAFT_847287 [Rickenella mellea]|uniref:Uncharacterized protein n=1 Tax=Rickenella mellea TaxID=50990 RepID=A0A4Y7PFL1_9AGAM|nr:hypothetical protein BD410DRAFT_847287 [Rickenella mellea]